MLTFFPWSEETILGRAKNNIGDTLEENSEKDKLVKNVVESMKEREAKALQEGLVCWLSHEACFWTGLLS